MAFLKKSPSNTGSTSSASKVARKKKAAKFKQPKTKSNFRHVVGMEIDSQFIRTVEIGYKGKRSVRGIHEEPLEADIVVGGDVVDAGGFAAVLSKIWKEQNYQTREVRIAVNTESSLASIQSMEDEQDFAMSLPFRIPVGTIDPAEYSLSFHNLGFYQEQEKDTSRVEGYRPVDKREILLVGLKQTAVDELVSAFRKARLFPVALDIGALSIMRANPTDSETGKMDVYVNVNSDNTVITVAHTNQPAFLRTIIYGDMVITRKLMDEMDIEEAYARELQTKCITIQASDILNNNEEPTSVFGDDENTIRYSEDQIRAYHLVQEEVAEMLDNINLTIIFFQRNNALGLGQDVGEIVLSGDTTVLESLRQRISSESQMEAVLSTPIDHLKTLGIEVEDASEVMSHQEKFATAIGMAIQEGGQGSHE